MISKLRNLFNFITKIILIILAVKFLSKSKWNITSEQLPISKNKIDSFIITRGTPSSFKNISTEQILSTHVSIVKGSNLYSITKEAIDLIGGMKKIVKPEDKVFIKPNYIAGGLDGHDPVTSGEISHPEVVASVAEECVRAGAKEVIIGEWVERPPKINFGGREGREGAQVKHLIDILNKKYGNRIYLINLMDYTTYFKYVPSKTKFNFLAIPNIVAESDVIISIPSLKTHHKPSPVSLGMKNFMGIMPSVLYGEPRYKLHEAGIHQVIVDINKALRPKLTVINGSFGMEGRGASLCLGGKPVDVSKRVGGFLVIAGTDVVATDAVAARLITKNWNPVPKDSNLGTPWYVKHIRMAYEQGLGILDASKINITGEKLADLCMNWEKSDDGAYPELPNNDKIKESK